MSIPKGNVGTSSAKISNVKSSGPQCDGPSNCGDLGAYGMFIRSINTSMEHFGDFNEISITMQLGSFNSDRPASSTIQNFERFLKDLNTLNTIKNSENVGVTAQWEQLEILLALTKEKDK